MNDSNTQDLENFLHAQVTHWNAGDKEAFLDCYRKIATRGLSIEYVGYPSQDPWVALNQMWDQQRDKIRIEIKLAIVSGLEAACHHQNNRVSGEPPSHTLELYKLKDGFLSARYFIEA
ncbi:MULTISPECIES: hypothetical protein [Stutzerimonas stutzeri subgroup]|uniref:Nuclear transport factor 2 family protein n=2 Tax=Stutzerimonas stutzeri subgroup TaxID=578833 RepID=A0A2N8SLB3_STUST|nr:MULTISPECIES: hypothetical protein [Stutzerimonas stutzeri subgroup]MCD1606444.1 nuclear transport factor 2 family protein [Stutzerimonas kunmingensis]MCQ4249898.1 nuclear transport factor 2 family protein [Stutzerimonas stutzeri]MCQ4258676.1 nuclear transport factor 2 family protein [Stutzerimonas stutzeri]PNG01240.1 hypothetical protein CXK98_08335 [Stutzerimonas kunmingensis]PNG03280.1 hypothetical protein CXL00_21095 [Stutzerimonas stutzeri]